ncbi:MAG: flagellar filament capping protein FliD [Casimicrobiaceae bacterium]
MATTPVLSSPGIGSGLDVNGIVQKLMSVEQQPIVRLDTRTTVDQAKISAFGTLKGALSTLQGTVQTLSTPATFNALAATVADPTLLRATVATGALAGSYAVEVNQLARAQKLVSSGFAGTTDSVGTGTLTFEFGSVAGTTFTPGAVTQTVAIGVGQDTLAGIRDAVNAANIGVAATIVNDGSANGNRLVFTVTATGAANSLRIAVADDDGNGTDANGLSRLAYDPAGTAGAGKNLAEVVAAQDALLSIDGIDVRSATNKVANAIQGVTLDLQKADPGKPTTLDVAANNTNVTGAIAAFVKAFNDLDTTFDNLTRYDASKKQASVLTGDGTVRNVQTRLRTILGGQVGSGVYSTLGQIGITFQTDGTVSLDRTKLDAALTANPGGVTDLFAAFARASDSRVTVAGYTSKTVPGTYALAISQLPARGFATGVTPSTLAIAAGSNDQITVQIDGHAAIVNLTPGTYANADALAAEVQARINEAAALTAAGASVTVTQTSGTLTVTSNAYGETSTVSASGGIFGGAAAATSGVAIVGTLTGQPLDGVGQGLRGIAGTPLEGLTLQIAGGPVGDRGTVTLQTGFAYRLNEMLKDVVGSGGALAARTDGLQRDLTDIGKRRDVLNARLAQVEANYRAQFTALDTLLSSLSAQSTALQQQLANLPKYSYNA